MGKQLGPRGSQEGKDTWCLGQGEEGQTGKKRGRVALSDGEGLVGDERPLMFSLALLFIIIFLIFETGLQTGLELAM